MLVSARVSDAQAGMRRRPASEELNWQAPRGCPDRSALLRRVHARLGKDGSLRASLRFEVQSPAQGSTTWQMIVVAQGERARILNAESCEALAQAALAIIQLSWISNPKKENAATQTRSEHDSSAPSSKSPVKPVSKLDEKQPLSTEASQVSANERDSKGATQTGDAMADNLASSVDAEPLSGQEHDEELPSTPQVSAKMSGQTSEQKSPARRRSELNLRGEWGIGAHAALGFLPGVSPGLSLRAGARGPHWAAFVDLDQRFAWTRGRSGSVDYGANFAASAGRLHVCGSVPMRQALLFDLCARGGMNWVRGRGKGELDGATSKWRPASEFGLQLALASSRPLSKWRPALTLGVSYVPQPPRFFIDGVDRALCCRRGAYAQVGFAMLFGKLPSNHPQGGTP
jgi:hypothetical protein